MNGKWLLRPLEGIGDLAKKSARIHFLAFLSLPFSFCSCYFLPCSIIGGGTQTVPVSSWRGMQIASEGQHWAYRLQGVEMKFGKAYLASCLFPLVTALRNSWVRLRCTWPQVRTLKARVELGASARPWASFLGVGVGVFFFPCT